MSNFTKIIGPIAYAVGLTAILSSGVHEEVTRAVIQSTFGILAILFAMRIAPVDY